MRLKDKTREEKEFSALPGERLTLQSFSGNCVWGQTTHHPC